MCLRRYTAGKVVRGTAGCDSCHVSTMVLFRYPKHIRNSAFFQEAVDLAFLVLCADEKIFRGISRCVVLVPDGLDTGGSVRFAKGFVEDIDAGIDQCNDYAITFFTDIVVDSGSVNEGDRLTAIITAAGPARFYLYDFRVVLQEF